MTIDATLFIGLAGEEVLVLAGVDFVLGMSFEAKGIDLLPRKHGVRCGAVAA